MVPSNLCQMSRREFMYVKFEPWAIVYLEKFVGAILVLESFVLIETWDSISQNWFVGRRGSITQRVF